jgi:hypothetical protein
MAPSSRSPDLPEATPVCAVSGQLRRPRQWSVMSPIRRLHSSRSRKYRSFVDGVVKGANRPFDALQEPPSERQEARESSSWLKAPVAPGGSIAGPLETSASGGPPDFPSEALGRFPRFRDITARASGVRFSPLGEARRLLCSYRCNTPTASAPPGPRRGASFTISAARSCCLRDV